jgi:hypothetical protein
MTHPEPKHPVKTSFQTALDTPWRAMNELRRIAARPYIRLLFWLHGIRWGRALVAQHFSLETVTKSLIHLYRRAISSSLSEVRSFE